MTKHETSNDQSMLEGRMTGKAVAPAMFGHSNVMRHSNFVLRAFLIALLPTLGGCQVVAVDLNALPPPPIKAVYEPEDQPTAIVIDDPRHQIPSLQEVNLISHIAGTMLVDEEMIEDIKPANAVAELQLNQKDFGSWPVDRIGQAVGAKQVIYVLVELFAIKDSDQMYRPTAITRVKVVDAQTGKRLFPADKPEGYPVVTRLAPKGHESTGTAGLETVLTRKLAEKMAVDVAHLFYKHAPTPVGSRLDE